MAKNTEQRFAIIGLSLLVIAGAGVLAPTYEMGYTVSITGTPIPNGSVPQESVLQQETYTAEQYQLAHHLMSSPASVRGDHLENLTQKELTGYVSFTQNGEAYKKSLLYPFLTHSYVEIDGHIYSISLDTLQYKYPFYLKYISFISSTLGILSLGYSGTIRWKNTK